MDDPYFSDVQFLSFGPSFAEESVPRSMHMAAPQSIDSGLRIDLNGKGEEIYYRRLKSGGERQITFQEFQSTIDDIFDRTIKFACKLSLMPNAVTVTVGWLGGGFGVVWNLNDNLCKKEVAS